jgi:hypothetical protein
MPAWARILGFAGLLPVAAGVACAVFHPARDIQLISIAVTLLYGGLILSFIGGAWWGLAARAADEAAMKSWLILSVIPQLWAWAVIAYAWVLAKYWQASLGISLAFAAVLLVDARLCAQGIAPPWWMRLRKPLSWTMALLFLVLAAKTYQ